METNKLELIEVGKITGEYIVAGYQRGYRWSEVEVKCLLDDIYSAICEDGKKTYCLQPIVVKKLADGKYELIDGQQRLTTVYLIYKYIAKSTKGALSALNISIDYATRGNSKAYLENLDPAHSDDYIDFYYMYNAYKAIESWFEEKSGGVLNERNKYAFRLNDAFCDNVKIIWYEVDSGEDSEKLFARLNIGRIPLTCAELVKAMFLSCAGKLSAHIQDEIAMQWDSIEHELHDDSLWHFLTNKSDCDDTTRIELVLDLIAKKVPNERDKMYTFLDFDKRRKSGEDLKDIWKKINHKFLLLKGWYRDNELYHKIGYLIATKKSLADIYQMSLDKNGDQTTKTLFKAELDKNIRESIKIKDGRNYGELTYTSSGDYEKISRLLLLFNVMTMNDLADRFPFDKFKNNKAANGDGSRKAVVWSLEHIHAQHAQRLPTVKEWQAWLTEHVKIIKTIAGYDDLVEKMEAAASNDKLTRTVFDELHRAAVAILSPKGESATMHNISNLALLNTRDNAALNDSTFAVKRAKIIGMDSKDEYIPFCTKMVFLKYYSPNAENMYFWSAEDRKHYVNAINALLYEKYKYLDESIVITKEEDE